MTQISGGSESRVELHTFGHVVLKPGDGGDANALLAQPKRLSLLCYLAIPKPGIMFRRDTLLGVFWPEGDAEHTRMALRQALQHIRKALGHNVIERRGSEEVGLNADLFWCDVAAYEQALDECKWSEAIELYRGELLKGFFLSKAPEFEHWLETERSRLASRYAAALEELAKAAAVAGKTRAAVEWWQSLVRHDPYDSRHATGLADALDRAGDPANALLYVRKHRELLRDELNITLPAELKALEQRVRRDHSDPAATVTPLVETSAEHLAETAARPVNQPKAGTMLQRIRMLARDKKLRWRFALPGLVFLLLGGILGNRLWNPGDPAPTPSRLTVALFRLQNLGPPDDSVYALGVTDALITRLSKISDLRITSGNISYSDAGLTLDEINHVFGASYYLTGTLQREPTLDSNSAVRVSVQLFQVSDGVCLWAEDFEVEFADVFQMYSDIGDHVARALNVTLLDQERETLAERPSQNPRAYEYFLVANAYFENAFPIRPELRNAVEWYEKAIAADSQFALAYAKLSMAHGGLYWGWTDRTEERLEKQRTAAETSLRLRPGLPEGQLALAIYYYWAHHDYQHALGTIASVHNQLETNYWYLVMTAAIQRRMGNFQTAARNFAEASDLNPLAFSPAVEAGDTYRVMRRYDEAHRYLDRYIATRPNRPVTYLRKALAHLEENGDVEKAREVLLSGPPGVPFDEMIAAAARYRSLYEWARVVRVLCGDCRGALDRMEFDPQANYVWQYYTGKALLYGTLGESGLERVYYDSAATILETFIRERPPDTRYHADLGLVYAALGNKDSALREATLAVNLSNPSGDAWAGYNSTRTRAEVYAMVGEPDSAVADLELILSTFAAAPQTGRYIDPVAYVPLMRIDPIWDPISDHPAFQALLEKYDPLI